jgi:predicted esterase YcpF (UPF0227 family)
MSKHKQVRKLGEEKYFKQDASKKEVQEIKSLIVPHKTNKNKNSTIICLSQDSDFVLVSAETLKAILEWYNNSAIGG